MGNDGDASHRGSSRSPNQKGNDMNKRNILRYLIRDDFDVMDEYKNWAAFDGITAKYEAIERQVIGSEEKQVQLMIKRTEVREIMGEKTMQELTVK